jgi:hypothetical protein
MVCRSGGVTGPDQTSENFSSNSANWNKLAKIEEISSPIFVILRNFGRFQSNRRKFFFYFSVIGPYRRNKGNFFAYREQWLAAMTHGRLRQAIIRLPGRSVVSSAALSASPALHQPPSRMRPAPASSMPRRRMPLTARTAAASHHGALSSALFHQPPSASPALHQPPSRMRPAPA